MNVDPGDRHTGGDSPDLEVFDRGGHEVLRKEVSALRSEVASLQRMLLDVDVVDVPQLKVLLTNSIREQVRALGIPSTAIHL